MSIMRHRSKAICIIAVSFSSCIAWFASLHFRKQHEDADVAMLRSAGYSIYYDHEEKKPSITNRPFAPRVLHYLLGEDFFTHPTTLIAVAKASQSVSDPLALAMQRLETIEVADFEGEAFTDNHLKLLAGMRQIQSLTFRECRITGFGFKYLRYCSHVTSLSMSGTSVNDTTCRAICHDFPHLESLTLASENVTDIGLGFLARLGALKLLDLSGTSVVGKGLRTLASRDCLEQLRLDNTRLSDESVQELEGYPKLRWLSFCWTPARHVTLRHLPNLTVLGCSVPDKCESILLDDLGSMEAPTSLWADKLELVRMPRLRVLDASNMDLQLDLNQAKPERFRGPFVTSGGGAAPGGERLVAFE